MGQLRQFPFRTGKKDRKKERESERVGKGGRKNASKSGGFPYIGAGQKAPFAQPPSLFLAHLTPLL